MASSAERFTLTIPELSRFLKITPRTLRRMVLRKEIPPPARVGARRLLWRSEVIVEFLANGGTPSLQKRRPGRRRKAGGAS